MRKLISSLVDLAGLAAITAGAYMVAPAVGFLVGGAALLVVGTGIDKSSPT